MGCLRCESGYWLQDALLGDGRGDNCTACTQRGCEVCDEREGNQTYCITCNGEFYMSSPGVCTHCREAHPHCILCSLDGLSCQLCDAGFFSNGSGCSLCSMMGCSICDAIDNCLECKSMYGLQLGECLPCSTNVPGCALCDDDFTCHMCSTAFYLVGSDC